MSKAKQKGVDPTSSPVMVCTEYRGVFFGYMEEAPKDGSITIKQAQNCVYWSSDVRGVLGLAATGPTKNCKVGPTVPSLTLNKVTAVVEVSPEAAEKWKSAPWA